MTIFNRMALAYLDGGIHTQSPPTQIADNELVEAKNMEYDESDDLCTRLGVADVIAEANVSTNLASVLASADINLPRWGVYDATNKIFFVSNNTGDSVVLIDCTDVEAPVPISSISGVNFNTCSGVVVDEVNKLCFVASTANDEVVCFEYSDPFLPTETDNFDSTDDALMNAPYGIAIDTTNSRIWVANQGDDSVVGISYTTGGIMSSVGSVADAVNLNGATGIALNEDGTYAYVTCNDGDLLTVVDLSTPATPSVAGQTSGSTINNPAKIVYAQALGHVFFTNYGSNGTRVVAVDVSTPATPTETSSVNFGNANPDNSYSHGGLTYDGGLLYMSCGRQDYVVILNVSEPANMVTLSLIQNTGIFTNPLELHYDVDSNNMFLLDGDDDKLVVLNLRNSAAIDEVGSVTNRASEDWEVGITDPDNDLITYWWDIGTAPDRWVKFTGNLASGPGAGSAETSATHGMGAVTKRNAQLFTMNSKKYLVVVGSESGIASLAVYNITDSTWDLEQFRLQTSGGDVSACLFYDEHLFIAKDSDGVNAEYIQVYDMTTPESPKKVGILSPDGDQGDFDIIDNSIVIDETNELLFVANDNSLGAQDQLHIIDISDKTKPVLKSTTNLGDGSSVDLQDLMIHPDYTKRYLYANMGGTLFTYQYAADGSSITELNETGLPGSNEYLYMGENGNFFIGAPNINQSELHLYSLADPTKPFHIAQYASAATKAPIFPGKGPNRTWNDHTTTGSVIHAAYLETVTLGGTRREMGLLDMRRLEGASFKGEAVNIPIDNPEAIVSDGVDTYVAASTSDAVTKLNTNNINSPLYVGSLEDAVNLNGVNSLRLNATTDILIAGMPGRVTVLDVSGDDPVVLGSVTDASLNNLNSIDHIPGSDYVYAITDNDYISIIDISDTSSPSVIGSLLDNTNLASAKGCAVNDAENRVYTVSGDYVVSLNVTIKTTPVFAGRVQFSSDLSSAEDVVFESDKLYVASPGNDTFAIFDVSTPDTPSLDGKVTDGTNLNGISRVYKEANQPRIFASAESNDSVSIIDVEDTTSPSILQTYQDTDNMDAALPIYGRGAVAFTASPTNNRFVIIQFQGLPFSVDVTSIFQFSDPDSDDDAATVDPEKKIILTAGTGVYKFVLSTGAITDITGSVSIADGTLPWQWVELDGLAIGVNGNIMISWNGGSNVTQITNLPSSLTQPKYAAVWGSRLFVAQGSNLYWSKLGDPTDFTDSLAGSVAMPDGKEITGLYAHKGHLFIFSRESTHRIQPGVPDTDETKWSVELVSNNLGCISAWSIQTVLDDVVWLSGSGVASLGAAEIAGDFATALASFKIKELRDVSQAAELYPSVVDDINSQYWVTIPVSGTDTTFVMDFKRGKDFRWTTWEGLVVGTYYAQVIDDDGEKQILIAGNKTLYRKNREGDSNPWTDAGGNYSKKVRTKLFDHELPYNRKEILRYGLEVEKKTSACSVVLNLYFGGDTSSVIQTNTFNFGSLGTGLDLVAHRKISAAKRRYSHAQLEITNSAAEGFCLNGFLLDVRPLTHRRSSVV